MGGEEWGGTALFDLAGLVATVIGGRRAAGARPGDVGLLL